MFTNRNRLSALALGTLLSISALQPALAEDAKEDAKMARTSQQSSDAPYMDSKKQVQVDDKSDKTDVWSDPACCEPGTTWYERQLRIPHG